MYFNGRWVPMEVMDTIFLFWGIGVLMIGAALFWLRRSRRSTKDDPRTPLHTGRRKRARRKKH